MEKIKDRFKNFTILIEKNNPKNINNNKNLITFSLNNKITEQDVRQDF